MKLKALGNRIIFKFVQNVTDGKFGASTSWGFQIQTQNDDPKFARWGEVTHLGPDVEGINVGDYILIEPLMWTNNMELEDGKVWGTNTEKVIAVTSVEPKGLI